MTEYSTLGDFNTVRAHKDVSFYNDMYKDTEEAEGIFLTPIEI